MKKIILLFSVLCASNSFAMNRARAAAVVAAPIVVPGVYHYQQTALKQQRINETGVNKKDCGGIRKADTFRPFVRGVVIGATPGINAIAGAYYAVVLPALTLDNLDSWANHSKILTLDDCSKNIHATATFTGFVSGVSLYATIPYLRNVAIRLIRSMPK